MDFILINKNMKMNESEMLDAEEYFHLAIHANSTGNPHASITYLKQALRLQPENSKAIYLLAVQHAELGLTDRAIKEMQASLAVEPSFDIVRFQLGLLLLDNKRSAEAKEQFLILDGAVDDGLRVYAQAMVEIINDDFVAAKKNLEIGLSQEPKNPALSTLMQRLLEKLSRNDASGESDIDSNQQANQLLMGAYRHIAG
jgi:tetratricopeptide (TPR) repeat protein